MTHALKIEPLTRESFAPFGDVIDVDGAAHITINQGFAQRCDGQAKIDVASEGGAVNVSLFTAQPRPAPIYLRPADAAPARDRGPVILP